MQPNVKVQDKIDFLESEAKELGFTLEARGYNISVYFGKSLVAAPYYKDLAGWIQGFGLGCEVGALREAESNDAVT